jgi:hypothetical protein
MEKDLPPGQSDDEIDALAQMVAENLIDGEDPDQIAQQLIDGGWKEDEAHGFVESIQHQLIAQQHAQSGGGGGEGMGWLVWIGVILLVNGLSYLFDWGFWLY